MASGLFDRHPNLHIVLGHMGEGLPFNIWRVDNRNAWVEVPKGYPAKRPLGDYFRENFHLTTSGNFRTQTLVDAMMEVGADRILFSTDWPFETWTMRLIGSTTRASRQPIASRSAARMPSSCSTWICEATTDRRQQ